MTAALHPAEPVIATERSRRGGRAGKRASGSATFEQPPFRQLKIPLAPTKLVSDDQLETIHLASLRVLKEIGVDVLHDGARKIMKDHGADVREGDLALDAPDTGQCAKAAVAFRRSGMYATVTGGLRVAFSDRDRQRRGTRHHGNSGDAADRRGSTASHARCLSG